MRTDDQCLRIFVELRTFPSGPVNEHGNGHFNSLAAPVFRQSVCIAEFFVVHKTTFLHFDPAGLLVRLSSCAADPTLQSARETKNWLQGLFKDRVNPCTANAVVIRMRVGMGHRIYTLLRAIAELGFERWMGDPPVTEPWARNNFGLPDLWRRGYSAAG
jgi:hypothetical protein